ESGWVSASCRWLSERPSPGIAPCVAWCFFFQAEDGIRDGHVTGVQTCALPIYDAHSRLRQRIAVRGSARDQRNVITSFAYDGMGRVLTSTGANGTQTTFYDDAKRRITVTGSSGLTEMRSYDRRGRLLSVSQTGDG